MSSDERRDPERERIIRIDCGTAETARLVRQIDAHARLGTIRSSHSPGPLGRSAPTGGGSDRATAPVDEALLGEALLAEAFLAEAPLDADGAATSGAATSGAGLPADRWIELEQTPGEPLEQLVERLGSRPPAVLVDAWSHQLNQLKQHLESARLPLHRGSVEDLRVDSGARLHIANLPLRIAESICHAEPACPQAGSLAPWFEDSREIDLSGFDALAAALHELATPPVTAPAEGAAPRRSAPGPASAPATESPRSVLEVEPAPAGRRAKPAAAQRTAAPPKRWWWFAAATAAAVALVVFWGGYRPGAPRSSSSDPSGPVAVPAELSGTGLPSEGLPLSGLPPDSPPPTAAPVIPEDPPPDEQRQPAPPLKLSRVFPDTAVAPPAAPPPLSRDQGFDGPAINLVEQGFDAPTQAAAAVAPSATPRRTEESATPARQRPAASLTVPPRDALDLPPRDDSQPHSLPALEGLTAATLSAAELQLPPGPDAWRWHLRPARATPRQPPQNDVELEIAGESPAGEVLTAAVLRGATRPVDRSPQPALRDAERVWTWTWSAEAAHTPLVDQLHNARLRLGERFLYLRTAREVPGVRLSFEQPQQTDEWALSAAAAPRASQLSLGAVAVASTDPASPAPLQVRWLQGIHREPDRSVRGLAEITAAESSPVAVRIRFDLEAGRRVRFSALTVATIDPTAGWHPLSQPAVTTAQDRLHAQHMEAERQLQAVQQQYARVDNRKARTLLRTRRQALEDQQRVLAEQAARLGELQLLVSRLAAELQWQIELRTEWPDQSQRIFASLPPPE